MVANRGEIALRILRTCKAMGIHTILAHSSVDAEGPGFDLADTTICLGPPEALKSYLSIDAIIAAAKKTGADAIHPGYGFLSERRAFSQAVEDAGITFLGPTPQNIQQLGDKVQARQALTKLKIPIVPGDSEAIADLSSVESIADSVGFPLLIKAAAGGGGKGMRVVERKEDLESAFRLAQSEALNAFGDGTLFAEKYLIRARHVEVQVLGDGQGGLRLFPERDCSPQRRHQKLLEETPCPVLSNEQREELLKLAHSSLKDFNYRGPGTLEFLYAETGEFYFLEMNTRLQVEHPITESITGFDLVQEQIEITEGKKLPTNDFEKSVTPYSGSSIEFRINAEDPYTNFLPSTGTITEAHYPGGPGVRVDTASHQGSSITPYYDSLVAKLIVVGQDRVQATSRLQVALEEIKISGVLTTLPVLKAILDDPEFHEGKYHIQSLEEKLKQPDYLTPTPTPELELALALGGILNQQNQKRSPSQNRNTEEAVNQVSPWVQLGRQFNLGGRL